MNLMLGVLVGVVCTCAPDISFATDYEDVLLRRHVFSKLGVEKGRYVDVGANHAFYASNTKLFHMMGWNGVVVDPSLANVRTHWESREGDVVLRNAASSETFKTIDLYSSGQLASVEPGKGDARTESVLTVSLGDICKNLMNNDIDLLSIDVERHEMTVLKSANLSLCRPKVIIVEILANKVEIENHMASEGYVPFINIGYNAIFVPKESPLAGTVLTPAQLMSLKTAKHIASLLRDAAGQGHINDIITDSRGALKLKDCWWDQHKVLDIHQRHLKPECIPSLFNTVFLREEGSYYTYTCGSDNKVMVVGNKQPILGLQHCAVADLHLYIAKLDVVQVAGASSLLITFKDQGSVLLFNYTHSAQMFTFVNANPSFSTVQTAADRTALLFTQPSRTYLTVSLRTVLELTFGSIIAACVAVYLRVHTTKTPTSPRCGEELSSHI